MGGLLSAGGWAGAGKQLTEIADKNIDQRFIAERDAMAEERQKRLAEYGDQLSRNRAEWEVNTLGPDKNKVVAEGVKATEQARADVKFDPANVSREIDAIKREAKAKSDAEIESMISTSKNGDYIKAVRNIALARHIVDPRIALQPQADGTVMRIDMNSGQAIGPVVDPITKRPMMAQKGLSDSAAALAKSYFTEGEQLLKNGMEEEGAAKMAMGRDILMGRPPQEKPKPENRPPLSSFNK